MYRHKRNSHLTKVSDSALFMQKRRRRAVVPIGSVEADDDMDDHSFEEPLQPEMEAAEAKANANLKQPNLSSPIVAGKIDGAAKADVANVKDAIAEAAGVKHKQFSVLQPKVELAASAPSALAGPSSVRMAAVTGGNSESQVGAAGINNVNIDAGVVAVASSTSSSSNNKKIKTNGDAEVQPAMPVDRAVITGSVSDIYDSNYYRQSQEELCRNFSLPLNKITVDGTNYYNFTFSMFVATQHDEGLYNLYFHACPNYQRPKILSFNVSSVTIASITKLIDVCLGGY